MAILTEQKKVMGAGIAKHVEEGADELFLDIVQKHQYQYPFKSVVREVMSNGIDSLNEKRTAREILTGVAREEDYYQHREGKLYKDSHFDASYYDLQWLDTRDRVELRYIIRSGQRDQVVISDTGIGLGGRRLQGYFRPGYSTKRLSKVPLGKFGIGGKSPLATNVEFYTVESCYNGRRYRFNVYSASYESIIPRFNLATGEENTLEEWDQGEGLLPYPVYSERTEEKNSLKVIIDSKKHNMGEYLTAVKSQLLYFDNVYLTIVHEDGREEAVPFRSEVVYEDDYILIGKQDYWSRPHLLLNKVNYGYVNWDELEMKQYQGAIGIKVLPEEVDVNPNRESLIWSDLTKQKMLQRIGDVREIATSQVQQRLQTTDFLEWYRLCATMSNWMLRERTSDVAAVLANIVNMKELNPFFPGDPRIRFHGDDNHDPTSGLWMRTVFTEKNLKANKQVLQVKRAQIRYLEVSLRDDRPIILMGWDERASNRKDKYLGSLYPYGFIAIYEPTTLEKLEETGAAESEIEWLSGWLRRYGQRAYSRQEVYDRLATSRGVLKYRDIEVPKDFTGTEDDEDKVVETAEDAAEEQVAFQSAEERRRLENKVVVFTPRTLAYGATKCTNGEREGEWVTDPAHPNGSKIWQPNPAYQYWYEGYTFHKLEVPVRDINSWDAPEVYYGTDADKELLHAVAALTRDPSPENRLGQSHRGSLIYNYSGDKQYDWESQPWYDVTTFKEYDAFAQCRRGYDLQHFVRAGVMLVKVAQNNVKYFRDFLPVQQFFLRVKDQRITMSQTLIRWNTARQIKANLRQLAFLHNFSSFNPVYARKYATLKQYVRDHWREININNGGQMAGLVGEGLKDLLAHLDRTQLFQEYVCDNPSDTEGIAALAKEFYGNGELRGAQSVDTGMLALLRDVLEFATACGPLLNELGDLTGDLKSPEDIPQALEWEIRAFLEFKGVLHYGAEAPAQPFPISAGEPAEIVDNQPTIAQEVA